MAGCDSTSAFVGHGKKHALSILQDPSNEALRQAMVHLGSLFNVNPELFDQVEQFVCHLYGSPHITNVNELRYKLFCLKAAQSSQLPLTQDALRQHTMHANYQAAVWHQSLQPRPPMPSPNGHGWKVSNNTINVHWMDQQSAPM